MPAARTPRRNGPYAPLSAFYADDDAVIALEDAGDDLAELLFLRGLAHCAREPKLNGYISLVKVRTGRIIRRPAPKLIKAAGRLVEVGLWEPDCDGGWRVKRWTKWNSSHEEILARLRADSARKGSGIRDESAPYVSALQDTSLQDTSEHGSSTLPPLLDELRQALTQAKIVVSWQTDVVTTATVLAAAQRCGVPALVRYAKAAYRPDDPAFSVKAFVAGWDALPGPSAKLELVPDPCDHGEDFRARCALCRAAS